MNSVVLIGRLARDPELSYMNNADQTAVCHFTLAVDRPRRNGEDQGADFIRVTVFGRQAENCDKYLVKGRQAAVKGRIQTGSYTNREGQTVYTTDVVADSHNGVEFLGGGQGQQAQGGGAQNAPRQPQQQAPQESFGPDEGFTSGMPDSFQAAEDDIPF